MDEVPAVATTQREKRRLQNRLAQMNYRKRMREIGRRSEVKPSMNAQSNNTDSMPLSSTPSDRDYVIRLPQPMPSIESINLDEIAAGVKANDTDQLPQLRVALNRSQSHKSGRSSMNQMMNDFETAIRRNYGLGSPRADLLLTLVQFNVFRALLSNTRSMGFTMDWLNEDASSPWSTDGGQMIDLARCPSELRPTALQRMIPHHPWIDLFPLPRMRDNLLLADAYYDEDKLCNDLIELCDVSSEKCGLIVWGEPWDPASWEASETFLRQWGWVVSGCDDIRSSTNHWRRQRGQLELVFEDKVVGGNA